MELLEANICSIMSNALAVFTGYFLNFGNGDEKTFNAWLNHITLSNEAKLWYCKHVTKKLDFENLLG